MQNAKTLNPILLGRPVQAFDQLATALAQQVQTQLHGTGHRPISIQLAHAHFTPLHGAAPSSTHIDMQRATVLAHMAARYGFTADSSADDTTAAFPVSSTERRIADVLHQAVHSAVELLCTHARAALNHAPATSASAWQWEAQIQVADGAWQPLTVALDAAASRTLEHYALQLRRDQRQASPAHARPAVPLHATLTARLLEKTVSTAEIQALRPGSVLPIAMGRATVLLNGEALLAASVAEHHGKLHLTAFETLE